VNWPPSGGLLYLEGRSGQGLTLFIALRDDKDPRKVVRAVDFPTKHVS
jgi:hypothetical protein